MGKCRYISLGDSQASQGRPHHHGKTGQHFLNHYSLKNSPTSKVSLLNVVEWILLCQFLIYVTPKAPKKENIKCQYAKSPLAEEW